MAQATTDEYDRKMDTRQKSGSFSSRSSEDFSETSFDGETESVMGSATHQLVLFAMTKGHTIHSLTHMPPSLLAEFLREFYGKVRAKLDEHSPGLKNIRIGLQKYFLKEGGFDIVKDKTFECANVSYEMAIRMGPRKCHRLRIEMDDLRKIYLSDAMDVNNPDTLQNKVFFDVNLYIVNRGKDCLRVMTKSDFDVCTDNNGKRYVYLKYHPKFSIREMGGYGDIDGTGQQLGDRMYERPGDPRCPVASFLKYVTHLHPMTEAFWQRPKRSIAQTDYVWFDNTPLGNSTLSKIMQRISNQAGMKENYTNHSIRSSYIPLIETICRDILSAEKSLMIPPPMMHDNSVGDDNSADLSSIDSESPDRDQDLDDMVDESVVGLRSAKMKVLELIRGLLVKDIQKFADWLKTVRVEYHSGELIVLCSPVDQASVDNSASVDVPDEQGGDNSSTNGGTEVKDKQMTSIKEKLKQNGSESCSTSVGISSQPKPERQDSFSFMQGISIKQVEFNALGGTHCSTSDLSPFKVTIPSKDALLVSSIGDNVQLLLHKKIGTVPVKEMLPDRVFYSENEMDVTEVAALLGACDSLKEKYKLDSCLKGERKTEKVVKPAIKLSPALKRQARVEGSENHKEETLCKKLCKSNSEVISSQIRDCSKDPSKTIPQQPPLYGSPSVDSPLIKKKRVRFGTGVRTITIKAEPVL